MPDIAFINGRFLPWEEATVSIDDRGFQFGDAVYEVIRTYRGGPFEFGAHLARLNRSAGELSIRQPYTREQWLGWVQQGLSLAGYQEAKIYIQVTRGVAPREHGFPSDILPTVVMTIRKFHPLAADVRSAGVSAGTREDLRWGRCDIKSVNLLANVLAREEAKKAGVFETILVRDGFVMEGALSNVMAVRGGMIMTAPEGPRILSGVTRTVVLELAKKDDIVIEERFIPVDVLYQSDEVFLTGTTLEVLGVVQIDGRTIGSGRPGPITKTLAARWAMLTG
ncbi:D-amino-acid transaminase [Candidatus Nitrospira nitrificans]|uniref:D-alanine aminotransferase n=1 Tax=Candidatus Nitrospira nitrificans TaxID=1742973 RepID=A0A0S4LKB9_9BACT|nr:D-amino-acid transaminase [Candidatus Nitrospira nitrificans]CUS37040.1 D-alanine aminotransferase [Candidatus Nitrospira nitrificans]